MLDKNLTELAPRAPSMPQVILLPHSQSRDIVRGGTMGAAAPKDSEKW